jgi:hypothetical protein
VHSVLRKEAMREVVALIARDPSSRAQIATCLADAGFSIEAFVDAPPVDGTLVSAVWVVERNEEPNAVAESIRPWLTAGRRRRAVIVTWRPSSVRDVLADSDRYEVLVPPVSPWQIADALRAPGGRW